MPWRIPEERLEAVKRSTDLVALARSRGIELKRHGSKDWIGRCPFHADRDSPNFIVSPDGPFLYLLRIRACRIFVRHP